MGILLILLVLLLPVFGFFLFRTFRKSVNSSRAIGEYILLFLFCFSAFLFVCGMGTYSAEYTTAIDIIDNGYTPLSYTYLLTPFIFFLLSTGSCLALWLKGRAMPPLQLVLCMVFLMIGVGISIAIIMQTADYKEANGNPLIFLPLPCSYLIIAYCLILKILKEEARTATARSYSNKSLQLLNRAMANAYLQPLWVLVLLLPVFWLIVLLLALLGQDTHSMQKVFTETTMWHFSQKEHPPFLGHDGHYLCTVAACGNPEIVKPLRLGSRHGYTIIVNRQLQVANAFEQLMEERLPSIHRFIRKNYDRYGYPLSKKINTASRSNLVYIIMKPVEYFFLAILYLCCLKPEEKIARQYEARQNRP